MEPLTQYLILLTSGFVLIGMEIFLPGSILGITGAILWMFAGVIGWNNFEYPWDLISTISLFFLLIITIYTWVKFFPKSKIGKSLTLNEAIDESASYSKVNVKIGDKGIAISSLRPSGIALFENKRIDVVADASWIDKDSDIEVINVYKGHVEVRKI